MKRKRPASGSSAWKGVLTAVLWIPLVGPGAETHLIDSAEALSNLRPIIRPGDLIVLKNGTYEDQHFRFEGRGTADEPVTLEAETPGKVILSGSSRLSIAGEHLIVDGLFFRGGALESGSVIEFEDDEPNTARHCVLRGTAIHDYNPGEPDTRYFWVTLNGYRNTVEYCSFSGQAHSGVTLVVRLQPGEPAGHIIRHNHFANRPPGTGNGFETIRIGTGGKRETNARCVVADNLFEACNGETEIISNKSCENLYSGNTFIACAGTLTLRQGDRCVVRENAFIGEGTPGSGGIRITGRDHRITGNYFSGTHGRGGAAIALLAGTPGNPQGGYPRVVRCRIEDNTLVDNPGPLFALDSSFETDGDNLLPADTTITNTLMLPRTGGESVVVSRNTPTGISWANNILITTDGTVEGLPAGVEIRPSVPPEWADRLHPRIVSPEDVGPRWMRQTRETGRPASPDPR